jgi:malonyl-CoA O-methyltransferase
VRAALPGAGKTGAVSWWERAKALVGAAVPLAAVSELASLPLATSSVDMAWSNLALQRENDPLPMMREVQRVLQAGGLFIFSTLGPDTLKQLRQAFAVADPGYAHVHDFIDMHDLGDMLVEAGFTAPVMEMETLTLTYTDAAALARDLRAMGMVNTLQSRRRGMSGRAMWARLNTALEAAREAGRLPARFEIVYGHAWKPQARPAPAETPQVVKFYPAWERKSG